MKELKKENVAFKVTAKNAEKLRKVFAMFPGEKMGGDIIGNFPFIVRACNFWIGINIFYGIPVVTRKQLRAILAKEHLKAGDLVVLTIGGIVRIVDTKVNGIKVEDNDGNTIRFDYSKFKRYATQEEIALLEGKKDFEVGKWYKSNYNNTKYLAFPTELHKETIIRGYGFDDKGVWKLFNNNAGIGKNTRLATPEEVESSLIEEAKRRGFDYDDFVFEDLTNILWANYDSDIVGKEEKALFNNGKWAEVIKQEETPQPFASLKEAFKKGAKIEYKSGGTWKSASTPSWNPSYDYRIAEVNPVGKWCKFWNGDPRNFNIGIYSVVEERKKSLSFPYTDNHGNYWKNYSLIPETLQSQLSSL